LGARGLARIHELELQMLGMVNRDRADPTNAAETKRRAKPLHWSPTLAAVVPAHLFDMLNHGYFDHEDAPGRTGSGRVESAGMAWKAVGENIAIDHTVASAEAAFMNEPHFAQNHRGNILNATFAEVGIGIVEAPNGALYITQDFCTPKLFH
jgi:uncharacterized protein YkwD